MQSFARNSRASVLRYGRSLNAATVTQLNSGVFCWADEDMFVGTPLQNGQGNVASQWAFTRGLADKITAKDAPLDHEHVHIGNEIEKELQKASEGGDVHAIFKVIEDFGEDFDEHNVATAFQELAKTDNVVGNQDVHEHETFLKLVDMAILGRRRFNARLLTSIVQSAAKLKYDDEALTDKISENLLQRMEKLDAIEVTDLATGLADLENSPSVVLFEALQKQANKIDQELSEDQKSAIKGAFKKLGYEQYGKKV